MIGFISTSEQVLLITLNYIAVAILHIFSSPLHTHKDSQSLLVVS
jgi:hypothetical protein